jgi:hypothetical protein
VFGNAGWNFGGVRNYTVTGVFGTLTFRNFWTLDHELDYFTPALSDDQTRGGPLMRTPRSVQGALTLAGRRGARSQWRVSVNGGRDQLEGSVATGSASLSVRPGPRWELSISPRYTHRVSPRQYVATRPGGGAATYGGRYVFAVIERSEVVAPVRLNYAITPDLTVEGYIEPFASSGRYRQFGELAAAGSFDLRRYGEDGTTIASDGSVYTVTDGPNAFTFPVPDFDIRSLRSNLVLRWEWRPGSLLYLVWQQNRFENTRPEGNVGLGGLGEAFGAPGDHFFAVKMSYWVGVR